MSRPLLAAAELHPNVRQHRWRPRRCLGCWWHYHSIRWSNASLEDISPAGWGDRAKMSDLLISHMMLVMMRWVSKDQVKMIMSRLKCDYQVGACEEGGFCWCFTNIQFDCWLQCWLGLRSFHHAACHLQLQPPGLLVYLAEGRGRV